MVLDTASALLVREPPSPPGRTCTVTTGQSVPLVHIGTLAKLQLSARRLPPGALVVQLPPVALPAAMVASMKPCPVAPTPLLINVSSVSLSTTLVEVDGPALTISIV